MPRMSVRHGVFETNSSSVHAIAIKRTDGKYSDFDTMDIRRAERVRIEDYGWDESLFYEPLQKLSYIWTAIVQCSVEIPEFNEDLDEAFRFTERWSKQTPKWWEDYLRRELHLPEDVKFDQGVCHIETYGGNDSHREFHGGMDHADDLLELVEALSGDPDLLRDFVYGYESYIWTGNDNDPSGPAVLGFDSGLPEFTEAGGGYERFLK